MKLLVKNVKKFIEELKEVDATGEFKPDIQFWASYGKPAAIKRVMNDKETVEAAVFYNYNKNLVIRIAVNTIISQNDGYLMTTEKRRIREDFIEVKQQSKKNILEAVKQIKDINLNQYFTEEA